MQDATESLMTLYVQLVRGPLARLPESDQAFGQLWQACDHPVLLLQLAAPLLSRQQLVQATVTCVRLLAGADLANWPEGQELLAWAQKWTEGQASLADIETEAERALEWFWEADGLAEQAQDPQAKAQADRRADLAYACHSVLHLIACGDITEDLDKAIGHALTQAWQHRQPEQAAVLRDLLPWPTLASLRTAYPYAERADAP